MPFALEHDPIDSGGQLVTVGGELDLAAASELSTVLLMLVRSAKTVVLLDLSDVTFIDSSALRALLGARREAEQAGKELRVVCGPGSVRSLLEMTNLTGQFLLYRTRAEALAAAV